MVGFIVFYIIGVVISFVFFLKFESMSNDITVRGLVIIFLISLLSWIMVLVCIGVIASETYDYLDKKGVWDKVIIHKKK